MSFNIALSQNVTNTSTSVIFLPKYMFDVNIFAMDQASTKPRIESSKLQITNFGELGGEP